jgi:hypothetical protein
VIVGLIIISQGSVGSASDGSALSIYFSDGPVIYEDNDPFFKQNVELSLDYLKMNYPENYTAVNKWIREIRPTDKYTCINNHGICLIDKDDQGASYIWLAGVLIHEAKHTEDDNTYFLTNSYSAEESERRAIEFQADYLGSVNGWDDYQVKAWAESNIKDKYWVTIPAGFNEKLPE